MRALPPRKLLCSVVAATLAATSGNATYAGAQTLARPGWTGSGLTQEPWWRSAVFYRIAPEHFQDSDGDGRGDLRGVAERLDYLQALGVDAVVLQLPFDEAGFDDLLAEASKRHIRLVIGLNGIPDRAPQRLPPTQTPDRSANRTPEKGIDTAAFSFQPAEALQAQTRQWLSRGAGGILLPPVSPSSAAYVIDAAMRRGIRRIAAEYPGERVVISSPASSAPAIPAAGLSAPAPLRLGTRTLRLDGPQLVLSRLPIPAVTGDVSASTVTAALLVPNPDDAAPLLELSLPDQSSSRQTPEFSALSSAGFAPSKPGVGEDARTAAAVLLTQKGALLLEYGQELGEPAPPRMPWTPSNVTPAATQPAAATTPAASAPIVYGPYRPYVPPPPKPLALATPGETPAAAQPSLPDIETLPGFSTEPAPAELAPHPVTSVAVQERDPHSLLNLYRTLLGLHHGNATLRNGAFTLLPSGDDAAVVWLRRAPAGVRTVASVLVAVNSSDRTVTLSLAPELTRLHLRASDLRSLRSLLPGNTGSSTISGDRLTLAPHAIFVGELTHAR